MLYPCIDCGILPSFYIDRTIDVYICPNCRQEHHHSRSEVFMNGKDAKNKWNEANHPDKLQEMINPCRLHPSKKNRLHYCYPVGCTFPPILARYWVGCRSQECGGNDSYHSPKEAIEKWNEINPKA